NNLGAAEFDGKGEASHGVCRTATSRCSFEKEWLRDMKIRVKENWWPALDFHFACHLKCDVHSAAFSLLDNQ
ncbi:hypothetical protein MUK42_06083, partial [Musa troglodytarum]